MGWPARVGLIAGGLLLAILAFLQLRSGAAVFDNASYHQTTFAAAGTGTGLLLLLLACLPSTDWMYRRLTTRPNRAKSRGRTGRRAPRV